MNLPEDDQMKADFSKWLETDDGKSALRSSRVEVMIFLWMAFAAGASSSGSLEENKRLRKALTDIRVACHFGEKSQVMGTIIETVESALADSKPVETKVIPEPVGREDAFRSVLESLEWGCDGDHLEVSCPRCGHAKSQGHTDDCVIGRLLRREKHENQSTCGECEYWSSFVEVDGEKHHCMMACNGWRGHDQAGCSDWRKRSK
jgi:hypothetical protein